MTPSSNSAPARTARRPLTSLSSIDTRKSATWKKVERVGLSGREIGLPAPSAFDSSL
jgi:hypothetical protein